MHMAADRLEAEAVLGVAASAHVVVKLHLDNIRHLSSLLASSCQRHSSKPTVARTLSPSHPPRTSARSSRRPHCSVRLREYVSSTWAPWKLLHTAPPACIPLRQHRKSRLVRASPGSFDILPDTYSARRAQAFRMQAQADAADAIDWRQPDLSPAAHYMQTAHFQVTKGTSMVAENPSSPNAIPARSSSTGFINGLNHQPSKSVLRPLPEDIWIASGGKQQTMPAIAKGTGPLTEATNTSNGLVNRRHSKKASGPENTIRTHTRSKSSVTQEWTKQKEDIIMGPYDYLFSHPGKDIRTALITAFNSFLHVPKESLAIITKVIGMLHTSSLLIDDVQDSSILRRGIPVAHNIFGTAQTINSANYVYFLALQELQKLSNRDEAMEIFTTELLNLHRGQGMDLYWRDTLTCPTEDDYLEMVQNKTGGLFRLAVKLMQAESTEKGRRDCVPLVNIMGLVFQICDDYLNLSSKVYTQNKGLCEDLTEGKFSFPIIHSIRSNPSNLQLINILKQKTQDDEVKRYAVKYMESTGSFEYCKKVVKELRTKAISLIDVLDDGSGQGEEIKKILDRMDLE